jgi:ABC-type nitrate/sulfonate/bicarbonate transport system permease component
MGNRKSDFQYIGYGLILLLLFFLAWEWVVRSGKISFLVLPMPSKILIEGARQLILLEFYKNWFRTLTVWGVSLFWGLFFGLLLGFITGASKRIGLISLPLLGYFRSIPPITIFPIALIAIGAGSLPVGVVSTLGAALYVFPGTAEAAREASTRFSRLGKILGASRFQILYYFVAPGTFVHALASSRIAATYSFAVCVAGEMVIGGRFGVGAAILDFSDRYCLETAYVYVLSTGMVGLFIDLLFQKILQARFLGSKKTFDIIGG